MSHTALPLVVCLGMAVLDRIFTVPALPNGPGKLYATNMTEVGGGPASTAAASIVSLGGQAQLLGRVGRDGVGDTIRAGLLHDGVEIGGLRQIDGACSAWSAVAIEPGGERSILNTPGAGLDVAPDWITPGLLAGAGTVLVDMGWPRGAEHALHLARAAGIPSVLDADLGPDPTAARLFGLADHVLFSAAALRHHAGSDGVDGLRRMQPAAPQAVLGVTLGAEGFLWLEDGAPRRSPAPSVTVVDTLGAGDVFHGAYALALAEGRPVEAAARFANAAAALKCTRPGGRAGVPARFEVDRLLSNG